jgi:hypothetical protein
MLVNAGGGPNSHFGNTSGTRAAAEVNMFGNTTVGAFVTGKVTGIFGVDAAEATAANGKIAHAGWNFRTVGTGPLASITYTGTATGYNNTDVIRVASTVAGGNAAVSLSTNSSGGNLALTITSAGFGFSTANVSSSVSIANSTGGTSAGSGATFTARAGGRAGREHFETIVAMTSLGAQTAIAGAATGVATVADASDDTILPDS